MRPNPADPEGTNPRTRPPSLGSVRSAGSGLRVLFAGATMVPDWGGGEPVVARLLRRGLEELGVDVLWEGSRRSFVEMAAMGVMPYDAEPSRVAQYRRRLREIDPDLVVAFFDYDLSYVLAAAREGYPVISLIQIYWPTCPVGTRYIEGEGVCEDPALGKCLRHIARSPISPNLGFPVSGLPAPMGFSIYTKLKTRPSVLSRANALVVPSEFMRGVMVRAGYRNVVAIHNAVDTGLFRPDPWPGGDKVVLYPVARSLQERKGYPHFVRLAETIRGRSRSARFRILNHTGDALIEGTPHLTHEQLAKELTQTYLSVVPGLWDEPFGLVVAETMAAGRPVVSYDGGGIPEIIENGVSGVLVPRGDLDGLVGAVESLLEDDSRWRRMGAAARARIEERFRYQRMAERYLDLILQVLATGGPSAAPTGVSGPATAISAAA
jgi:glycosyltransferase involved in cell wall biosynthesis